MSCFVEGVHPRPYHWRLQVIADHYEKKANFPHWIGSVDGKHIWAMKPADSVSNFFNYEEYYSIQLMAVEDSEPGSFLLALVLSEETVIQLHFQTHHFGRQS